MLARELWLEMVRYRNTAPTWAGQCCTKPDDHQSSVDHVELNSLTVLYIHSTARRYFVPQFLLNPFWNRSFLFILSGAAVGVLSQAGRRITSCGLGRQCNRYKASLLRDGKPTVLSSQTALRTMHNYVHCVANPRIEDGCRSEQNFPTDCPRFPNTNSYHSRFDYSTVVPSIN